MPVAPRPLPRGSDGTPRAPRPATPAWPPPRTPTELGDRWVSELDRHDVSRAALIASIPGDAVSVAEAVAHHPHRFVGFFMHNPVGGSADTTLERALKELNMRAVCLFPAMHGYRLGDEAGERGVKAAANHGAAVFVHCGVLTVGVRKKLGLPSRFDLRLGDPLALARVAVGFPQVPVIVPPFGSPQLPSSVPHCGSGFFREALIAADQCPTIHFDTSSSNSWMRFQSGLTL